ncbi:Holliday junction resolvase RecU [Salibacterium qingdaonense]|uniref:Holliday junction resolvase RecU n=1 Tax=Salibacterium qingdaonense TaxID=266892 RepID=A0A1I4Q5K6_9BACI|nr:Holliday junction resolvase RecU [Salibacterium qingdaonense]SFM35307.1 recombination protein U [Salibacterium qingdaonense]
MKQTQANRGMGFENLVNTTNLQYKNKGLALISKRPTPMKIIGSTKGGQNICVFDQKSTVDFDGVYRGLSIQFEAKSTGEKRFDLKMITDSQIDFLQQSERQGAVCFVLLEIRPLRTVYYVPNNMLQKYVREAQRGGRKSIPLDDLEIYADVVTQGQGIPLDYLAVVDKHAEKVTS